MGSPNSRPKHLPAMPFIGVSRAYRRFAEVARRTQGLLEVAELGVTEQIKRGKPLLDKFQDVPPLRGRRPKKFEPRVAVRKVADDMWSFSVDARSAAFMKRAVTEGLKWQKKLTTHFCAALCVYTWAAFETYITML